MNDIKIRGTEASLGDCVADSEDGVVERRAKIINNIEADSRKVFWHGLGELDFVNILSGVHLMFNDADVRVRLDEGCKKRFELSACPFARRIRYFEL